MPTYQYACTACGHRLEAVQSFTDPALQECPECRGALRKVFSAVGVVFKGSGFYRTDSRAAAKSGANGSKDGAAKEGAAKEGVSKDGAAKDSAPKDGGSAEKASSSSTATSASSGSSSTSSSAA